MSFFPSFPENLLNIFLNFCLLNFYVNENEKLLDVYFYTCRSELQSVISNSMFSYIP